MTSATRSTAAARLGALADELVSLDLDNANACEVARRQAPVAEVHDPVDLGRLACGPPLPRERRIFAGAVDQDVRHGAGERSAAFPGEAVLIFLHERGAWPSAPRRHRAARACPGTGRRARAPIAR